MIENKYFETVVLALILLSSFVMTLEDVWFTTKPMLMDVLYYLDKILTVVFFLETCLKLVAMVLWTLSKMLESSRKRVGTSTGEI